MQKLHLVGITTEQDGLILSARRNARSGGYLLVLDDALARAVEDLRTRQAEEAEARGVAVRSDRVESKLPVSEMQARLRRGRSLKDVAKDAGVDPEWVERFADPVFAEMAQVITRVRNTHLKRQRLGPSAMRIGDAVRRNLAERGVAMTPDEYDSAWSTHQRADGRWLVKFAFHYRGSNRTLRYDVTEPGGDVIAGDPLTGQLSYITPPVRRPSRPKPTKATSETAASKRAVVSSGFRADKTPVKAVSRPAKERERAAAAMSKAVAKRAVEGERAAARKAKERSQERARREREERAEAIRRERKRAAEERARVAAARAEAIAQADRDRAAAAAAAARQAERDAARRAAREKAAKRVAQGTPKRAGAKAPAAKAPAAKTRAAKAPVRTAAKAAATRKAPAKLPAKAAESQPPAPRGRPDDRTQRVAAVSPAPERPTRAAPPRPEARVDAPAPVRRRVESEGRAPSPSAPEPSAGTGLSGAAVDVYGPEATRALFRAGLVEQASEASHRTATPREDPEPNGRAAAAVRKRPPGARRTRPLRAN